MGAKPRKIAAPKTRPTTHDRAEHQAVARQMDHRQRAIEGGLLAVTPLGIVGWARDPRAPENPLEVTLLANDLVVGKSFSARLDLEVVHSRVGPGIPGFIISPTQPLPDAYPVHLTLRDEVGNLLGKPLVLTKHSHFERLDPVKLDEHYEGMVEGIRDGFLVGWILQVGYPHLAVPVELYDGDEQIAAQTADRYRGDLEAAGKRQGRCAFAFELPISLLDGRVHSLRVLVRDSHVKLGADPVQLGPLTISTLVEEVTKLRQETRRLQLLVDKIVSPSGTLQSEIVQVMSDRVAAFAEVQRDMVERELDALRALAFQGDRAAPAAPIFRARTVQRGTNGIPTARQQRHE